MSLSDEELLAAAAEVRGHAYARVPFTVCVIAWCDASSHTMWQRPHLMHRS